MDPITASSHGHHFPLPFQTRDFHHQLHHLSLQLLQQPKSDTDDFLQHVALNFILAGRDISSVTLSWFFWLISTHPAVEQAIISELYSFLSDTRGSNDLKAWFDSPLASEELERLVYLKAALSEMLRLYPSVPEDSKHVIADDVLPDNTFIPTGSAITYSIYSTGRMKSVWRDDCLEFRPERWLSDDGSRFEPPADFFKFMAFNAGPRVCLGKDLAYLQMRSIVASVLLRYHLALVPGHRAEQKMSPRILHTLHQILLHLQRNHQNSTSVALSELMYTWRGGTQQAF